ncbi:MAG: helix-turn-helix domain-containing protein [Actinomycetota bacterium]
MQIRSTAGPIIRSVDRIRASAGSREQALVDATCHRLTWPDVEQASRPRPAGGRQQARWTPAGAAHPGGRSTDLWVARFESESCPIGWRRHVAFDGCLAAPLLERLEAVRGERATELASLAVEELLDAFATTSAMPPLPLDPRGRAVAERLGSDPSSSWDLADWAHEVGTSERTLRRIFLEETGLTFRRWRLLSRLDTARRLLDEGRPVASVARCVGYESAEAFTRAFRHELGRSPRQFARVQHRLADVRSTWPIAHGRWPEVSRSTSPDSLVEQINDVMKGRDMIERRRMGAMLVATGLALAACGGEDDGSGEATRTNDPDPTRTTDDSAVTTSEEVEATDTDAPRTDTEFGLTEQVDGFPAYAEPPRFLEVIEDRGDTVVVEHLFGETEVPKNPDRVFAGASALEILLPLGVTPVAGTSYFVSGTFPPPPAIVPLLDEVPQIAPFELNLEFVAESDPDLIIVWEEVTFFAGDADQTYEQLSQIAPTIVLNGSTEGYWPQAALAIGGLIGLEERARELIDDYEDQLAGLCQRITSIVGDERISVISLGPDGSVFQYLPGYNLDDTSFIPQLTNLWAFRECGLTPALDGAELSDDAFANGTIQLSEERLSEITGDWLFASVNIDGEGSDAFAALQDSPLWSTLPAVENGNVVPIEPPAGFYFGSVVTLEGIADALEAVDDG